MTCTICLHTYPSLNSYEIDQRRHQKAFDLRQLVACPLCVGMVNLINFLKYCYIDIYLDMQCMVIQCMVIHANPVFGVPVSWGKVLGILRPLPNRQRNNKRFLDMGLYLNVIIQLLFVCTVWLEIKKVWGTLDC